MASLPLAASSKQARSRHTKPHLVAVASPARLSALEWSIVAMAERDGVSSLREPGRLAWALNSLFGLSRPNKLADPRLESLRRVAVYAWRNHWNVPRAELKEFEAVGFTMDQYELIQASIDKGRQTARRWALGK